uniref:Uncharacterized protein LOC109686550 n=1 Tax=Castor canadensis TaxID=51338 RepID=A0A8B7UJJ4_CASCN|nr:uncharacterized protein LOC109686550 [Castor canadensis]
MGLAASYRKDLLMLNLFVHVYISQHKHYNSLSLQQAGIKGCLCACVGAEPSPAHVRAPGRRRAPRRAGGKARGKPPAASRCGGGRTGGVWNSPAAILRSALRPGCLAAAWLGPFTQCRTERFPRLPERGAAPRGGAGNSRGLSGGALAGSAVPSSSFPGRAGALDTASADQAARVGGVAGAPRPAGGERGLRDCSSPAARRAGRPSRPRSRPPPLRGLRLLPSHTLPGRPGPQAFPALLLPLSTFAPARVLLLPAGLAASGASPFPRALLSHTRALACWAAPFSPACPLTPPSGGGGLMSLQHHAAAAEEGESYTRTEKHSS